MGAVSELLALVVTICIGQYFLILSRSVHNIRIERLWCDLTSAFGAKWKTFFQTLELHEGLNRDSDAHMWLLHHLFLGAINQDALEWAEAWNNHRISIRGERQRSPRDMFFFGMIQNGPRGIHHLDDDVRDIPNYGIDWDDYDNDNILDHHYEANHADDSDDGPGDNPFMRNQPERMMEVNVDEPGCPLTEAQVIYLNSELNSLPYIHSRHMESYRLVWISAIRICEHIFSGFSTATS
jgi:hypothetical protein